MHGDVVVEACGAPDDVEWPRCGLNTIVTSVDSQGPTETRLECDRSTL